MRYRVLGPVSAYLDERPRKLGGKRQRIVLAILLSRPNTVIDQDALIEAVWAGDPPQAAKQTLHTYVSTLRKALNGGIDRNGDGYVVPIEEEQLDSLRFEALAAKGRTLSDSSPLNASTLFNEALDLWHGRAFGDLGGEPALVNEAIRLDESRLTVIEYRIEADLNIGNHLAVIQELEALTREHPFRERLLGFLMLALYRAGRQADALRTFRRGSALLADELGIDPSAELQTLEQRILDQDNELMWRGDAVLAHKRAARGYELRDEVARNRFGTLHRAFQGSVGREVAVLELDEAFANSPELVRRFESELHAVSQLEHPHILPIHDFWRGPDGAFLVTTYLRGGTLDSAVQGEPWSLSATLRMVDQISSALDYAHRSGHIHGGVAPESVGLDEDGNAYISDFGLARLEPGRRQPSESVDAYSLALLAWLALTGTLGDDTSRPISAKRPDLAVLDAVFQRALNRDESARYGRPDDLRRAMRQAAGADVVASPTKPPSLARRNPYKGLRAFQEADASDFHGRDAQIEELVEILAKRQLLAVVGPSGSGKSSLVRAGLLPSLRSGSIAGSTDWLMTDMFPGTHPMEELEAALLRVAADRPSSLTSELTSDARGLVRVAKQILRSEESQLALIVDQFEELFSLTSSEADRRAFLNSLVEAATDVRSGIKVILTMRADFFDQPLEYPEFAEVMKAGLVAVAPPTDGGLARAIAQPAKDAGVDLEPGLVTRIVDDVRNEPGGLPLMQYALMELFAGREHNTLTLAAYQATGGVVGALGRRAEEIYKSLPDEGRNATRQLFLRLVAVDELADDTRRRVRQTEMSGLGIDQAILDDVIGQYGSFRLLSFDRDAATRTPTIEVAHEALIREWARLRTWIDDRREDLLIHRRIQVNAIDWRDSGKDPSYLLRGGQLEQALVWQERTDLAVSDDEMSFIEASIEQEKRELSERRALEDRSTRRRKALVGVLLLGLVVSGILGAVALRFAANERDVSARATAREIAKSAVAALDDDQELAVLLALEAIDVTEDAGLAPVFEASSALREALRRFQIQDSFPGYSALVFGPGDTLIADDAEDPRRINVWTASGEEQLTSWSAPPGEIGPGAEVAGIAYSAIDGQVAVSWSNSSFNSRATPDDDDGEATITAVTLHESSTLTHQVSFEGPRAHYLKPSFGAALVASTFETVAGHATLVWERSSRAPLFRIQGIASFVAGSNTLLVAEDDQAITWVEVELVESTWVLGDEKKKLTLPSITPAQIALSPDGTMLALSVSGQNRLQVWDVAQNARVIDVPSEDQEVLAWSPDGTKLAVAGHSGDIAIFSTASLWDSPEVLVAHSASVFSVDFSSDSERIASASIEGLVRTWNIANDRGIADRAYQTGGNVGLFFLGSDGDTMTAGIEGRPAIVVDLSSGELITQFDVASHFGIKPDETNSVVASWARTGDEEVHGVVVDARTGELTADLGCRLAYAVSSDIRWVVTGSPEGCEADGQASTQIQDLATGEDLFEFGEDSVFKATFSPTNTFDGNQYLVVNFAGVKLAFYSLTDFSLLGEWTNEEFGVPFFLTLDIDPTGHFVGVGTQGPKAIVIDMEELAAHGKADAVVFNQDAATGSLPQVRVSQQGVVATSGFDGFYRVWDLETGELYFEIDASGMDAQGAVQFTWDGTELAYEDEHGNIRFTPLDNASVVVAAQSAVTRSLTDDECSQYLHTDGCEG